MPTFFIFIPTTFAAVKSIIFINEIINGMKKHSNIPHLARAAMLLLVAMLTSMAAWATDVTYTYTCSVHDKSEMRMGSSNSGTVTVGDAWSKNQSLTFTNDKISIATKAQIGHNGTYFCMKPQSSDAFTFTISSTDNTWYIKKVTVKYNYNGSSTVSSKTVAGLNVHTLDVSTSYLAAKQDNYLQGFEVELTDQPYYSVTPAEGLQIATSADAFAYNAKTYFHYGATVAIVPQSDVHVITATDGTVNDATIADNKRSFSFSMPAQDITPSATLEEAHTVTLSGNVSITDPLFESGGNRYYKSGDQITITAVNAADIIDQISGISNFAIADNRKSATFTMPTSDLTLAATTSEVYTVKFPSSVTISEPYITIDNTKYYKADDTYTLTVANADHIIDAINGVTVNYSDDLKSATFKMPHGYLTITYAGTYKPYTVTIPDYLTVSGETPSPVTINGIDYYKTDDQITLILADDDPNNVINTLTATGAESSSIATDRRSVNITVGTQDINVSTTFLTIGGTCGDGLTWQMTDTDNDGTYETLTISGSGAIAEYADGNAPWYADHAAHITRVNIGDQITTIPGNLFYGINADIVLSTPAHAVQYKEASFANAIRVPFGNFLFHATDESGTPAYAITDEQDLRNLAAVVNAGTNGSGMTFYQTVDITMSTNDFTPIGNKTSFYGTYDGGNHAITGLNATTDFYDYSGLFGKLHQATVQNIILVNPTATATDKSQGKVGAIAGCGEQDSKVSNCHVINPTVSATNTDKKAVGAIIGLFRSGSVSNCYFYDSNADHNYPTVGENHDGTTITNVSAAHTITLADDVTTTATPAFSYLGTDYYAEGTITLSHTERTDGYVLDHYIVNNEPLDGDQFTLTADATVSATWKIAPVSYIDADGTEKQCTSYTLLTGGKATELKGDNAWYVVQGNVEYSGQLSFKATNLQASANAHIILADGATLTVTVSNGSAIYGESDLTFYGQANQTGTITATGKSDGINSSRYITINGGNITASGSSGIFCNAEFTINRGTVNASGGNDSGIYGLSGIALLGGKISATATNSDGLQTLHTSTNNTNYTITIDGDRVESLNLGAGTDKGNSTITVKRNFTTGVNSTIMLPFAFDASSFTGGTFHTLSSVAPDEDGVWTATMSDQITNIAANTPYIFVPAQTGVISFTSESLTATATGTFDNKCNDDWTLQGVYEKTVWTTRQSSIYGFASKSADAKDETGTKIGQIQAGEFVRAGANSSVRAMRAYLKYSGDDTRLSKSAIDLPDRIIVVFPDETASVIDPADLTTPVSEIAPTSNTKVWSYDKTIYIAAAPNQPYTVIDITGRPLITGTTATDRDEIHLPGTFSGIVIVRIANQSFKIKY